MSLWSNNNSCSLISTLYFRKEHKTPRASSSSSGIDVEVETSEEASVSVKKSSASSNSRNNALLAKKLQLPLRNVSHKSQNLIAKFIADCVNTKLKAANKLISNKPGAAVAAASSHRNKKKNKSMHFFAFIYLGSFILNTDMSRKLFKMFW